jgi:hypothetical protein
MKKGDAILNAIGSKNIKLLKSIIETSGAINNTKHKGEQNKNKETNEFVEFNNNEPLKRCCEVGFAKGVSYLIKMGANCATNNHEPLLKAIHSGSNETVQKLIDGYSIKNLRDFLEKDNHQWVVLQKDEILNYMGIRLKQKVKSNAISNLKSESMGEKDILR